MGVRPHLRLRASIGTVWGTRSDAPEYFTGSDVNAATLGRDAWKPEQPGGFGVGALFALLAHGALVAMLAIGVSWRSSPPDAALSAELWSAVPEVAAPKPVEPPPPQPEPKPTPPKPAPKPEPDPRIEQQRRDAQIAIEKAEREKKRREEQEEKERAEKLKADKLKAEKAREEKLREEKAKKDKLEEERKRSELTAKLREQQLARMRELAGATGGPNATGSSLRDAAPSAGYAGRIRARIKPNLVLVGEVSGNPKVEVEVRCAPDGRIIGRRVVKSSGNAVWDETVLRAIDKTEVLPRDTDGRVPSAMVIEYARQE
jgi:colicin import membrane protein